MTTINAYGVWLFWCIVYAVRSKKVDLAEFIKRSIRTKPPWWKFKPNLYHNELGKEWHIWFADEPAYTERRMMELEVHISMETGRVVGLDIWDEKLES